MYACRTCESRMQSDVWMSSPRLSYSSPQSVLYLAQQPILSRSRGSALGTEVVHMLMRGQDAPAVICDMTEDW